MAAPTSPVPFSLAEGSDSHEPFTPGALGLNTPAKRAQTSEIWTKKMAMRIRGESGRAQALRTQGYTHVCVLKLANGSPCNHALKLTKGQSGTWLTTIFIRHVQSAPEHAEHPLAIQHRVGKDKERGLTRVGVGSINV